MARVMLDDKSVTLGEALKRLRAKGLIHGALAQSIDGLWGYASNEPGVRHGATSTPDVKPHEGHYVVDTCGAALSLFLELDRQ
jgi:hypothetical protein